MKTETPPTGARCPSSCGPSPSALAASPFALGASRSSSDFSISAFSFCPPPFSIAGFRYYDGAAALPQLQPGTALTLRSQADNPHDPWAVEILHGPRKLGYVPRFCNRQVSQLLRGASPLTCEVAHVAADAPPWDAVAVRISLPQALLEAA